MRAGPPSGNTTVPYKDSRLLPSHAPPVVTARFESLPPRLLSVLPCTFVLFFSPFFLRVTNGFGSVRGDRDPGAPE